MEEISTEMTDTGRYVYRRQMLVVEKGTVAQIFQSIRKLYMHKSAGTECLFHQSLSAKPAAVSLPATCSHRKPGSRSSVRWMAVRQLKENGSHKVTVKKNAPKGTYLIIVTAKENKDYAAATRMVKVVVK